MSFIVEHGPALAIAVPLMAAFATPLISRAGGRLRELWAVLCLAATLVIVVMLSMDVLSSGVRVYALGASIPSLTSPGGFPIRIVLEVDAMSAMMGLISVSIALLVCIYSTQYMKKYQGLDKFYALLLMITSAMLGLVFTGDLFNMFVFLELLSVSSGALVAFYMGRGEPAEAAFKYVIISATGALMVLLAVCFLYGQYNLLSIGALAGVMQFTFLDKIALVLLVSAFALKCGAVPLHMWVSDAYGEAPVPVTAVLVVVSQASLYALFRVSFTLYGAMATISVIGWAMIILGILSMFIGVTLAMMQRDIKRLMAYHAISQTGYMLLGVGVGLAVIGDVGALSSYGMTAIEGGLFHVINHAMYKGLLFLTAGAIIYRTGTRDLNKLGGLAHAMPVTTCFFIIGMLSIAGLPPFNGFSSKIMIYESVFMFSPVLSIIAILVSILTLASFVKVFQSAFLGPKRREYKDVKEVPVAMLIAMGILAFFIILFGLLPDLAVQWLIEPAAKALLNQLNYVGVIV